PARPDAGDLEKVVAGLVQVAEKGTNRLARLHAVWGLGQLGAGQAPRGFEALRRLVKDRDSEVRAQVAKVLRHGLNEWEPLLQLMKDPEPRVRLQAALSLAAHGGSGPLPAGLPARLTVAAVALLHDNDDRDAYLRHAGVMVLARVGGLTEAAVREQPL